MNISTVQKPIAKSFLSAYHYLGNKGFRSSFIYGIFDNDTLMGVCVFHGISAPETVVGAFGLNRSDQEGFYELGRLAMHPSLNGGNHTSWFVSKAIKQLRKDTNVRAIISYADSSAGHVGSIYRACNALYCGTATPKFDYVTPDGKVKERFKPDEKGTAHLYEKRWRGIKHRYVWIFDPSLSLKWEVESCNWNGIKTGIKINRPNGIP